MRKMKLKESIKLMSYFDELRHTASFLRNNITNKKILYVSDDREICLIFKESNFMHLTGIKYIDGPKVFFNACIGGRLDIDKVRVKVDNTTFLKLDVIGSIKDMLSIESVRLTSDGKIGQVYYDAGIRSNKMIYFISLKEKEQIYIPTSLIHTYYISERIPSEIVRRIDVFDY